MSDAVKLMRETAKFLDEHRPRQQGGYCLECDAGVGECCTSDCLGWKMRGLAARLRKAAKEIS